MKVRMLTSLLVVLVLTLFALTGCENVQNPVEIGNQTGELTSNTINFISDDDLIGVDGSEEDWDEVLSNPGNIIESSYLIDEFIVLINTNNYNIFKSNRDKIIINNKFMVLSLLIQKNELAAIKKIENDLYKEVEKVNPQYQNITGLILKVTHFMLSNPDYEFYWPLASLENIFNGIENGATFDCQILFFPNGKIIIDIFDQGYPLE